MLSGGYVCPVYDAILSLINIIYYTETRRLDTHFDSSVSNFLSYKLGCTCKKRDKSSESLHTAGIISLLFHEIESKIIPLAVFNVTAVI